MNKYTFLNFSLIAGNHNHASNFFTINNTTYCKDMDPVEQEKAINILLKEAINDKSVSKDDQLSRVRYLLSQGADPNLHFREAFVEHKNNNIARVFLENDRFIPSKDIKTHQDTVEMILRDLSENYDIIGKQISIIYDLVMLKVPLTQDAINRLNARLIDKIKTLKLSRDRYLGTFIENGYIPSKKVVEEALKYDNTKKIIEQFPKIRYDALEKQLTSYIENITASKNFPSLFHSCTFWIKKFTYLGNNYRMQWADIVVNSFSEEDINRIKGEIGDFSSLDEKFEKIIPELKKLCKTVEEKCDKLWGSVKGAPLYKDLNIFERKVYDTWMAMPDKPTEEKEFIKKHKANMDKCANADFFAKVPPKAEEREIKLTTKDEKVVREHGSKPSHWTDMKIPKIEQVFRKDTATYLFHNSRDENGRLNVNVDYYRDETNDQSYTKINGILEGDEKLIKFIGDNFPKIGITSCVKLLRHPILGTLPVKGQDLIKEKIYQYLDVMDILTHSAFNKEESGVMGLVLYSKYNRMLMLINFGMDMALISSNADHRTKLSNSYRFGDYSMDGDFLVKNTGKMLTLQEESDTHYNMTNQDQIFHAIELNPDHSYSVMIAPRGTMLQLFNESLTSIKNVSNFSAIKKAKVATIELYSEHTPVEKIHDRKVKIMQTIDQFRNSTPVLEQTFPCIYPPKSACIYEINSDNIERIRSKKGDPMTVYGTLSAIHMDPKITERDSLNDNPVTRQIVMHPVQDKIGEFYTFEIPSDIMHGNLKTLASGQIVIFVTNVGGSVTSAFFMKVDENRRLPGESLFIELNNNIKDAGDAGNGKEVRLSFPDLKKTYKLSTADLNTSNLPRCDYKLLASEFSRKKLLEDYTRLTEAYVGLVTGVSKIKPLNVLTSSIDDLAETFSKTDSVKGLVDAFSSSEHDVSSEYDVSSEDSTAESDSTIEIPRQSKKNTWTAAQKAALVVLIGVVLGVGYGAMKYYTGVPLTDPSIEYESVLNFNSTVNAVLETQRPNILNSSAEQATHFISKTLNATINASPDVAKQALENKIGGYTDIGSAFRKITQLFSCISDGVSSCATEGIHLVGSTGSLGSKMIGSGAQQLVATSGHVMGPLNEAQTSVLTALQNVSSTTDVSLNSLFEITIDGGKSMIMSVSEIIKLSVNDVGEPIHHLVSDKMKTIATGYGPAVECLNKLMTATGMPDTSFECNQQIMDGYTGEQTVITSLGSRAWSTLSMMSYTQTFMTLTVVAALAVAVGTGAGAISVPALLAYFAGSGDGSIMLSRVGIHSLIALYHTAISMNMGVVAQQLLGQIRIHSAQDAARVFLETLSGA